MAYNPGDMMGDDYSGDDYSGDETVGDDYLKESLGNLRTPRHLFKFLHRLIEEHCQRHTEDQPRWTVDYDTFRTTFASYMRDLDAFDRGYGHG